MRILLEHDDGRQEELKRLEGITEDTDVLLIQLSYLYRTEDTQRIQDRLTEQIGKRVVILPRDTIQVLAVPR
jgi:hypothetical protein